MKPTEPNKVQAIPFPHDTRPAAAYRRGVLTLAALALLTGVEFWVSAAGSLALMAILGLAKAGIIVQYFMHLSRLWNEETEQ